MKLPADALIAPEKLTHYLLVRRNMMAYQLYEEVVLLKDIADKGLLKGDVATIVDHHPVSEGEDGYSLEVFNALGETLIVITLPESAIAPLTANDVFTVRVLAA